MKHVPGSYLLSLLLSLVLLASPGLANADQQIRVVTYNISWGYVPHTKNYVEKQIYDAIKQLKPDLLAIQEFKRRPEAIAQASGLKYFRVINSYARKHWKGDGMAVFSRWPIETERLKLGQPSKRSILRARLAISNQSVSFYNVHLDRFKIGENVLDSLLGGMNDNGHHLRLSKKLINIVKADPTKTKILVGDFNTFPYSASYDLISKYLSDSFDYILNMTGTYRFELHKNPTMRSLPNPRIDYIFHSDDIEVVDSYVAKIGPSDHYPVVAVLRLRK